MFTQEGTVSLIIGKIDFTECRFPQGKGPSDFDICVEVTNAENAQEHDWVYLEWSNNYGIGTMSHMKQRDISLRTLHGIGFEGEDLIEFQEQFQGRKNVPGYVKKTTKGEKTYHNVYLGGGGGNAPKPENTLDHNELLRRLANNKATGTAEPKPATATAKPATGKNPFAAMTPKPASTAEDDLKPETTEASGGSNLPF